MAVIWEWHDRAACAGAWPPVDMIYLERGQSAQRLIEGYCNQCPVILECAEFALSDITNTVGIWGGVHLPETGRTKAIKALRLVYTTLTSEDAA